MPKTKQRKSSKLAMYVKEFPVFKTDGDVLFCKICSKVVSADKIYSIKSHISSAAHVQNEKKELNQTQQFLGEASSSKKNQFTMDLCKAFICADIPLYKFRSHHLTSFFSKYMGQNVPSESTMRGAVSNIYKETIENIKVCLKNEYVWISIDETTDSSGRFVANVIIGALSLDESIAKKRFLLNISELDKVNHTTIARLFDDSVKILGETFNRDAILLFVSDAAPYMVKAAKAIATFYPKIIHVTCVAHGLHRVCEKIRECHPQVDRLISSMKKVFLKAPSRVAVFKECEPDIPLPPVPIVTRWGTWMEAVSYYAKFYEKLPPILNLLDAEDSRFIKTAKTLLADAEVRQKIIFIDSNFGFLVNAIKKLETTGMPLISQIQIMTEVEIKFENINCEEAKEKLCSVISKNKGYQKIKEISNQLFGRGEASSSSSGYTVAETCAFKYAPITSVDVERSFSMYKALYRDNRRSFSFCNLAELFVVYCNNNLN